MLRLEQTEALDVTKIPLEQPRTESLSEPAAIGKSLVIKGEVTGSESLYIDGKVEGAINLPGNRVTIGRNGQVAANISAREIVVIGKVLGNINASERIDIRSEGSLTGDVITARISIEDGAFFRGGIDIRKPGESVFASSITNTGIAKLGSPLAAIRDLQADAEMADGQYEMLDDEADVENLISRWRSGTPVLADSRSAG
jgi:cytoskeletal protein CcmA (bactofilin family)